MSVLNELVQLNEAKAPVSPLNDAVMKAVEIATDAGGAMLNSVEVTEDEAMFEVVYEFPEHRTGLVQDIRKAFKGNGTVSGEKLEGGYGQYVLAITLQFKVEADKSTAELIEKAIREKHKEDLKYFGN